MAAPECTVSAGRPGDGSPVPVSPTHPPLAPPYPRCYRPRPQTPQICLDAALCRTRSWRTLAAHGPRAQPAPPGTQGPQNCGSRGATDSGVRLLPRDGAHPPNLRSALDRPPPGHHPNSPKDSALEVLDTARRDERRRRATWYTDGSLLEGRAGGAAVRVEEGGEGERIMVPLGNWQVCEGEMEGLVRATERAIDSGESNILCVALRGILSTAARSGQFHAVPYDILV
ncbi:hypothetical protein B0H19DRAFT_1071231 [Mycena capillaripes]|nr:hypothetical protein B0H19DRAFT_1071231 [Mycena capillaripes]